MKPTLITIFSFLFIAVAVYAQKPHVPNPIAFQEMLPLPIIVTQDKHNKNVYQAEIKWYDRGVSPDERVFKRMRCENGVTVDATNV
ncbi:7537_t:CDS:2, partial [Racocetra persica]